MADNAAVMEMLQGRLSSLMNRPSGYIEGLPKDVRNRITGLMGVQSKHTELETKFHEEVLALEKKYAKLYEPLYERRAELVAGKSEPSSEEVEAGKKVEAEDKEDEEEETSKIEEVKEEGKEETSDEKTTGIPEFWLTALKNHPRISELITERDEVPLRALIDVRMSYLEENPGFRLSFHFAENETFSNEVLSKTYYYQSSAVEGDLVYDRAEGTKIDWKPNQDLTVTVETKRQRHKGTNKTRVVKKTVPAETFFDFFSPPVNPSSSVRNDEDDDEEPEEDLDEQLEADYELGEEFKEKIVPHAIDWFTGKALRYEAFEDPYGEDEEDDYYEGDEDEDEDEDEDDEDEDDDDEEDGDENAGDKKPATNENAPECKQQ